MTRQTCIIIDGKRHSIQIEEATDRYIQGLIKVGYGKTLTEVFRHAVRETWERQGPSIVECYPKCDVMGWNYSTDPTGEDAYSIKIPCSPHFEGTVEQIKQAIREDRGFNSLGGAFYSTAWFYNGRRIIATWDYAIIHAPTPNEAANMSDEEYYEKCEYGWKWVPGFQPPEPGPFYIRLLIEK